MDEFFVIFGITKVAEMARHTLPSEIVHSLRINSRLLANEKTDGDYIVIIIIITIFSQPQGSRY